VLSVFLFATFVVNSPAITKSNNNVGKIDEGYIFDVGKKWAGALEHI
jgi:hypothetical protein